MDVALSINVLLLLLEGVGFAFTVIEAAAVVGTLTEAYGQ